MSPSGPGRPEVSLVVPSYRGERKIPVLLEALRHQDTEDFEAVIVIDGRLDDSPELIERAAADGLPVRAVVLEENQGRVAALNAGFAAARGEVLVRCDDDLEPAPDFVSGHAARHAASASPIGVVGLTRDVLADSAYARAYGLPRTTRSLTAAYRGSLPAWRHWAANCSITRDTWESIGAYSTAYQHYGWEDVDYGYRLDEAGIDVVIAPELEARHLGAATTTRQRTLRAYQSGAARRAFETQHGDSALSSMHAGDGWWGSLVGTARRLGTEQRFERAAALADAVLPWAPRAIGEKLVALSIESATLAGYDHAESVSATF